MFFVSKPIKPLKAAKLSVAAREAQRVEILAECRSIPRPALAPSVPAPAVVALEAGSG
jgi:hypothetical protein